MGRVHTFCRICEPHRALVAVAMTRGWGHGASPALKVASNHAGVNVNAPLPSGPRSFEPLSKQAHMTGIPVEVRVA